MLPELPDVESFKQYFDKSSLHKKIKTVVVKSKEILGKVSTQEFQDKLRRKKFQSTQRFGKYLFTKTDSNFFVVIHFGMTGNLKYFENLEDEPAHSRILIEFRNGAYLSYDCQRKLGEVDLTETIEEYIEEKNLGPDVLDLDFKKFKKILEKRRGTAKYTLMNQHIMAGIGNIYSDEILFQSEINPKTKIFKLDEQNLNKLFKKMQKVLKTAIDLNANPKIFPKNYLIPNRMKGGKCPKGDVKLERIKVSGRTTYFCPKHQKMK